MGRWLEDVNGPGSKGDERPCTARSSTWRGDVMPLSLLGELGRELKGDAGGNGELLVGDKVKRKMRGSICQNARWLVNISIQPSPLSFSSAPTVDCSLAIRPILSSFERRCLPLNIPSLLT